MEAREQAYASAQRIAYERMAGELGLPTGLSASQIDRLVSSVVVEQERSTLTGFSDPNYFSKVFRRFFGASPTEFRTTGMYATQTVGTDR